MRNTSTLLVCCALIILLGSCTGTYTTATSYVPVSQVPTTVKKTGDISIKAGIESHGAFDNGTTTTSTGFMPLKGFDLDMHGAVNDKYAVGLGYHYTWSAPYINHSVTPSFTFFQYYALSDRTTYGFNVLAGINFSFGNNFVEFDGGFHAFYVMNEDKDDFILNNFGLNDFQYYNINEFTIRPFVQTSFSIESRLHEFHIGTNFGMINRVLYDSGLDIAYESFLDDGAAFNPIIYYNYDKTFFGGETFISLGFGPEAVRFISTAGIGYTSDQFQDNYFFMSMGMRGNIGSWVRDKSRSLVVHR